MLAFALLYVVLGLVGRSTTIEGTPFGLVWPAGGVAVLWFLVRGAQARSVDTAVLVLASFVVNWVTGASPGISAVLVATNVLQTLLAVALSRCCAVGARGCGGAGETTRSTRRACWPATSPPCRSRRPPVPCSG